jgi:8-oxo-dGTP diphosphatase
MIAFGAPQPGIGYRDRPGAYALAFEASRGLLVLDTEDGLELPGGGIEAGEGPVEALARELIEETGYRLAGCLPLVGARQYLTRPAVGKFYHKLCSFYLVRLAGPPAVPSEPGNHPRWTDPPLALGAMAEECQNWALAFALEFAADFVGEAGWPLHSVGGSKTSAKA